MSLKSGMEMTIKGVPKLDPVRTEIYVSSTVYDGGHDTVADWQLSAKFRLPPVRSQTLTGRSSSLYSCDLHSDRLPSHGPLFVTPSFYISVGHSDQNIALQFGARFKYLEDIRTIILNTFENGSWGKEQRVHDFPFVGGQEFEMTISLTNTNFFITLPDGKIIKFPNRLGDTHYDHIAMAGDVMVHLICVK